VRCPEVVKRRRAVRWWPVPRASARGPGKLNLVSAVVPRDFATTTRDGSPRPCSQNACCGGCMRGVFWRYTYQVDVHGASHLSLERVVDERNLSDVCFVKQDGIQFFVENPPESYTRSVACHMGSHSVICHQTQVNTSRFDSCSHTDRYSICLPSRDGRLNEPCWWLNMAIRVNRSVHGRVDGVADICNKGGRSWVILILPCCAR